MQSLINVFHKLAGVALALVGASCAFAQTHPAPKPIQRTAPPVAAIHKPVTPSLVAIKALPPTALVAAHKPAPPVSVAVKTVTPAAVSITQKPVTFAPVAVKAAAPTVVAATQKPMFIAAINSPKTISNNTIKSDWRGNYTEVSMTTYKSSLSGAGSLSTDKPMATTTTQVNRVGEDKAYTMAIKVASVALDVVSAVAIVADVIDTPISPGPDVGLLAGPAQIAKKQLQSTALKATESTSTKLTAQQIGNTQIKTQMSADSIVVGKVNPSACRDNCLNVAITTEERNRGVLTTALASDTKPFKAAETHFMTKASPKLSLDALKQQALPGNGSRAIVAGYPTAPGTTGHAFNAVKIGDQVVFYDRQITTYAPRIFTEDDLKARFLNFAYIRTH